MRGKNKKRYGMVIDTRTCVGCGAGGLDLTVGLPFEFPVDPIHFSQRVPGGICLVGDKVAVFFFYCKAHG